MQQIIISGLGGQGVLFVTRLLAETALTLNHAVLISETHGMAQRGGNVISHLKVNPRESGSPEANIPFTSPLIRPGRADILLAMHPDGLLVHGSYLKPAGTIFLNTPEPSQATSIDATAIATALGSPVSANLVLLGFAAGSGLLFSPPEAVEETIRRLGGKRIEVSLKAFKSGCDEARARFMD